MCERIHKDGNGKHYDVITVASAVVVVVCKNNEVLFCSPLLGRVCFFSAICVSVFVSLSSNRLSSPYVLSLTLSLTLTLSYSLSLFVPHVFSSFAVRRPERCATFPLLVSVVVRRSSAHTAG